MSLKSRTEKNIKFLDFKIESLEKEVFALKKMRFRMYKLLNSDDRYIKRLCDQAELRISLVKLRGKNGTSKS